ncbi:MAG TPA: ABC transporter ATP-binding protein [Thermoanaerobaculia bacterium]|nr:ABC transporter ATP-binding protein [Thermoanaerobaculia bacterium]HUM29155.1 ABC transporter ATP-binding protein [Thermoanaerobaculia bacterium]HXK67532.1 ABC transporter ATP-binding protein [Thermoanaerobaculia bacterium]
MDESAISIQELKKSFNGVEAVKGVSYEIKKGETFGLLGPNGAGKTTTINLLVGILTPDSGSIRVDGSDDPTRPEVRRSFGICPQSLSLYEELTGEENLLFFGRLYHLSGKLLSERVRWALDFAGLTERKGDRVVHYSGGMKRRLNLVTALLHDPPILLLDEPTVGVDPQSRNLLFDNIEKLRAEGRTILYTTHYMEEAQRLCDRVAIMDHGEILAMDTVDGLIRAHGGPSVVEVELDSIPDKPESLPGSLNGSLLRIETESPLESVADLGRTGLSFLNLKIHAADLENVFLNLTGRRLRDQ